MAEPKSGEDEIKKSAIQWIKEDGSLSKEIYDTYYHKQSQWVESTRSVNLAESFMKTIRGLGGAILAFLGISSLSQLKIENDPASGVPSSDPFKWKIVEIIASFFQWVNKLDFNPASAAWLFGLMFIVIIPMTWIVRQLSASRAKRPIVLSELIAPKKGKVREIKEWEDKELAAQLADDLSRLEASVAGVSKPIYAVLQAVFWFLAGIYIISASFLFIKMWY